MRFVMLIGLPASGKSTYAASLEDAVVVSSDAIREELLGDVSDQERNDKVFLEVGRRVKAALSEGAVGTVVLDATNISKKRRVAFLKELSKYDCEKCAVWFAVPYAECLRRNASRERVVPEHAIAKMLLNFNPPSKTEGFDKVEIVVSGDISDYTEKLFFGVADTYSQENRHHKHTLGEHCRLTYEYVRSCGGSPLLQKAALLHDIGKPFTASYTNGKGEQTDELHYLQHHCVGSYEIPFYLRNDGGFDDDGICYVANLVYYHTHPRRNWKSAKSLNADRELVGNRMFYDIMILNIADVNSH